MLTPLPVNLEHLAFGVSLVLTVTHLTSHLSILSAVSPYCFFSSRWMSALLALQPRQLGQKKIIYSRSGFCFIASRAHFGSWELQCNNNKKRYSFMKFYNVRLLGSLGALAFLAVGAANAQLAEEKSNWRMRQEHTAPTVPLQLLAPGSFVILNLRPKRALVLKWTNQETRALPQYRPSVAV